MRFCAFSSHQFALSRDTCPKSPLCCLTIPVPKLSIMGKIYPVRVLFHKLPLTCPTIHFSPLLRCPKTNPFYGLTKLNNPKTGGICRKHKSTLLWTPKSPPLWTPSIIFNGSFYGVQKLPCACALLFAKVALLWTQETTPALL